VNVINSIERERQDYFVIIVSGIAVAILIQFIPSLFFQAKYKCLIVDLSFLIAFAFILFRIMVKPRKIDKEFLTVLVYDLKNKSFLPTGFYALLADQLLRESSHKFIEDEEFNSMFERMRQPHTKALYAEGAEEIVQALLVEWLHHVVSQFEAPLARAGFQILSPLPSKLLLQGIPSLKEMETCTERINPREVSRNPYMTIMASITLPKNTNLKFTEHGIQLLHKRVKISLDIKFKGILLSPSKITEPYFSQMQRLYSLLNKDFMGDLSKRKLIEILCVVGFQAEASRWAKDIQLKWVNELCDSLEKFLHWDQIIKSYDFFDESPFHP